MENLQKKFKGSNKKRWGGGGGDDNGKRDKR